MLYVDTSVLVALCTNESQNSRRSQVVRSLRRRIGIRRVVRH